MPQIAFSPAHSEAQYAIVVSVDLCGFSDFCNRSDAHVVLPKFLSRLFEEHNNFLRGELSNALENFWGVLGGTADRSKIVTPEFNKFTGDGALMIWEPGTDGKFSDAFCTALVKIMRGFQSRIAIKAPQWEREWRVDGLPHRARVGIATGSVYPLKDESGALIDYVGYCINLAVRLQNHCPEVGFLVHKTVHPNIEGLVELEALGMKGTRTEPVFAFKNDLKDLQDGYFRTKFRRL